MKKSIAHPEEYDLVVLGSGSQFISRVGNGVVLYRPRPVVSN
jgi:hypothetical protein